MKLHRNARTCPHCRALVVGRVIDGGQKPTAVALEFKVTERTVRKWLKRLPHPYTAQDRAAGYRYDLSVLQAEFARTQVLDRPVSGRMFFEDVIRENLDLGRPDNVQLIFARRVTKRTPGRFRTRVLTEGVLPSLHVEPLVLDGLEQVPVVVSQVPAK